MAMYHLLILACILWASLSDASSTTNDMKAELPVRPKQFSKPSHDADFRPAFGGMTLPPYHTTVHDTLMQRFKQTVTANRQKIWIPHIRALPLSMDIQAAILEFIELFKQPQQIRPRIDTAVHGFRCAIDGKNPIHNFNKNYAYSLVVVCNYANPIVTSIPTQDVINIVESGVLSGVKKARATALPAVNIQDLGWLNGFATADGVTLTGESSDETIEFELWKKYVPTLERGRNLVTVVFKVPFQSMSEPPQQPARVAVPLGPASQVPLPQTAGAVPPLVHIISPPPLIRPREGVVLAERNGPQTRSKTRKEVPTQQTRPSSVFRNI